MASVEASQYQELTKELAEELEKYIYPKRDGTMYFDIERAKKEGYNEQQLNEVQEVIDRMNESIEKGYITVGETENDKRISKMEDEDFDPEHWSPSPVKSQARKAFCLSHSQAEDLEKHLREEGLSDFATFLGGAAISGAGLYKVFGAYSFVGSTLWGAVTMGGQYDDLRNGLVDAAWEMDDDQYVVITSRVEHVWHRFGDWTDEEPPDEQNSENI